MFQSTNKLYCTLLEEKLFKKDGREYPFRTVTVLLNGKTKDFTLSKDCEVDKFIAGEYYLGLTVLDNGKIRVTNIVKEIS